MPLGRDHKVDFLFPCALWCVSLEECTVVHRHFNQGLEPAEDVLSK